MLVEETLIKKFFYFYLFKEWLNNFVLQLDKLMLRCLQLSLKFVDLNAEGSLGLKKLIIEFVNFVLCIKIVLHDVFRVSSLFQDLNIPLNDFDFFYELLILFFQVYDLLL